MEDIDSIENKISSWARGDWIPQTKTEEDAFLDESSVHIGKNCKNNPGSLGEWVVKKKLEEVHNTEVIINHRLPCNWLDQHHIRPDLVYNNEVGEVKTLRYFNTKGKRGNQGTGSEKLDSIFRKYSNVKEFTGRDVTIYLVADQQLEKNGHMFLEAFNNNNYGNNRILEKTVPIYKDTGFTMIAFKDLN